MRQKSETWDAGTKRSRSSGARRARPRARGAAAVVAAGCVLAACGSSSSGVSAGSVTAAPVAKTIKGTLTEWNWDTAADSPGSAAVLAHVVIPDFEHLYPGVTVQNTSMSLPDQLAKLPLALRTASSAPIVTQTNEGFGSMGLLVQDGELMPLERYNALYGWFSKVGTINLKFNSFTSSGKQFGEGNVYGVPWTASLEGVYYNKRLLAAVGGTPPTSWSTLLTDLALLKKAGKVADAYSGGTPTTYNPVHVLYTIADQYVPAASMDAFVFHTGASPTINTPGFVRAAALYQSWATKGYFEAGYQGESATAALSLFTSGKAGFYFGGDWYASTVAAAMGTNAGFWVPPEATGGPGEGWSIPVKSANPNLAATFINQLLSPTAEAAQLEQGDIPATPVGSMTLSHAAPLVRAATAGWDRLVQEGKVVPYLDYATPSFLNQEMSNIQELLARVETPSQFVTALQQDYATYWASK